MIQEQIEKIEAKIGSTENIPAETRQDLLALLATLKSEIAHLDETHSEDAQSIARFAEVSTHEATREEKRPDLVQAGIQGLTSSVEGFESSHPHLVQSVNQLAVALSNMGI